MQFTVWRHHRLEIPGLLLVAGCSSIPVSNSEEALHSVGAQLFVDSYGLPVAGKTAEVEYELDCDGTFLNSGVIPVPIDGSPISGQFGAVGPAHQCQLTLSATLNLALDLEPGVAASTVHCFATTEFEVVPHEPVDLGQVTVVCRVDIAGNVASLFSDFVQLVEASLQSELFESDAQLSVEPNLDAGVFPPVMLRLAGPLQPGVNYTWSVEPPSGGIFFGCDEAPAECEFHCNESGTHAVVITASFADQTLSRSVELTCLF